jgi:hypothetical protein
MKSVYLWFSGKVKLRILYIFARFGNNDVNYDLNYDVLLYVFAFYQNLIL